MLLGIVRAYEGVEPILELFLVLELKITCFYVIIASILCHGKAMSAFEIDSAAESRRYRTESSLRYLRGPGCYEVRRFLILISEFIKEGPPFTCQSMPSLGLRIGIHPR